MNGLNGNQRILISISAFVLVMAIIVGVLFVLSGKEDSDNLPDKNIENTVLYKDDEDASVSEMPTSRPITTSRVVDDGNSMSAAEGAIIQAYISGSYYISGIIYADDVGTQIDMAITGKNFHTSTTVDGMDFSIMFLNNKVYFVNDKDKKYIDFNSIVALMGGQLDFDLTEFEQITEMMDMSKYDFDGMDKAIADLNGVAANCYRYYNNELSLYFYFVDDELRQIDFGSADGSVATTISVNEFSPSIPSNMLTLSGLTQATIFDFFGEDLMQQLQ